MPVPSNTYLTYAAVGIREDLSDVVTMISPVDTQFYSAVGSESADQTRVEWLTDSLASASTNAHLEGDDRSASAIVAATRLYNMCQIQAKTFRIADTTDVVKSAGNVTSVEYQTAKAIKELARDIEFAFLREVRVDGSAGTARKMRGALNWVTTNLNKAADATLNADGTVTGGTARALTEDLLKTTMQNIFVSGGDPSLIFCGGFQARKISGFAQSGNYRQLVENRKIEAVVDVFVTEFGTLNVKPHRLMPADVVFICDINYWKKSTLRPTARRELAKTGDSRIFDITVEHTLKAMAEAANGRITNLTTS